MKEKDKEVKAYWNRKHQNTQKKSPESETRKKRSTKQLERNKQNGNSESFPVNSYLK